jgi:hypothetical protein
MVPPAGAGSVAKSANSGPRQSIGSIGIVSTFQSPGSRTYWNQQGSIHTLVILHSSSLSVSIKL